MRLFLRIHKTFSYNLHLFMHHAFFYTTKSNIHIVKIRYLQETCSTTFVVDQLSELFLHLSTLFNQRLKWQKRDSNPQTLKLQTNTHPFSQTGRLTKMYWPNDWLIFTVHLTVCSCHVMYASQSQSTLCNCLNVEKFLLETDTISEI